MVNINFHLKNNFQNIISNYLNLFYTLNNFKQYLIFLNIDFFQENNSIHTQYN